MAWGDQRACFANGKQASLLAVSEAGKSTNSAIRAILEFRMLKNPAPELGCEGS